MSSPPFMVLQFRGEQLAPRSFLWTKMLIHYRAQLISEYLEINGLEWSSQHETNMSGMILEEQLQLASPLPGAKK
ncbi:hypothetical protein TNCV_4247161 [Trichonephila clavipes]|nr:hypothetical protein TNCV_4247161 [Trichonephila clavipes]